LAVCITAETEPVKDNGLLRHKRGQTTSAILSPLKEPYVKDNEGNEIMFNTMRLPYKELAVPHIQSLRDVYSRVEHML